MNKETEMTDYTMYIYKRDARNKSGERRVSTTVWSRRTEQAMAREVAELNYLYPARQGYRFEYFPRMIFVNNLMTGKSVEIDRDTPFACSPASETYWSS